MPPRKPGELPSAEEIQRRAREKVRELEKKTGVKKKPLPPGGTEELGAPGNTPWFGVRIAKAKRPKRATRYA